MRLTVKVLWLLLILYTLIHLSFFNQGMSKLVDLMRFDADPLIIMVFNLMGLIPLAFLIYALILNVPRKHYVLIGLGFLTGAFSLAGFLLLHAESPVKKQTMITKCLSYFGLIGSMIIIVYGVIYGDIRAYYEAFLTDSFIHIMTIDFIVLNVLLIITMRKHHLNPFIEWVPVVGFYQWLLKIKQ
mgnify:CR=1 FL=1